MNIFLRIIFGTAAVLIPLLAVYFFSTSPSYSFYGEEESGLIVSLKHSTQKEHDCTVEELLLFRKEQETRLKHMRNAKAKCGSRQKLPLVLKIIIDENVVFDETILPSGFWGDNATSVFKKTILDNGLHNVEIFMQDSSRNDGKYDYSFREKFNFRKGEIIVIDFNPSTQEFFEVIKTINPKH